MIAKQIPWMTFEVLYEVFEFLFISGKSTYVGGLAHNFDLPSYNDGITMSFKGKGTQSNK